MASQSDSCPNRDPIGDFDSHGCIYKPKDPLVALSRRKGRPVHSRDRTTIWCALCYGRFAKSEEQPWQAQARIIGEPLPGDVAIIPRKVSISTQATFVVGNLFDLLCLESCDCGTCDQFVEVYSNVYPPTEEYMDMSPDSCLIPVHEACLNLYKQHLRSKLPASNTSFDGVCADKFGRLLREYGGQQVPDPDGFLAREAAEGLHRHYGALKPFQFICNLDLEPADTLDAFVYDGLCNNRVFDMDPLGIDSSALTALVLSFLTPILLPRPDRQHPVDVVAQPCHGDRLPLELLNLLATDLSTSCVDLPRQRDGLLPGSWWKQELIKGKLLPWLWDLDEKMIERKERRRPVNWFGTPGTWIEWDWESLVRRLSQTQFYQDFTIHKVGEGLQLALKNRRRIFLIFDDLDKTKMSEAAREKEMDWADDDCEWDVTPPLIRYDTGLIYQEKASA